MDAVCVENPIKKWDDEDQHQFHHKASQWMDFKQEEVEGLCFKTDHGSTQKGIKKFGDEEKASAMKDACNMVVKNDCFWEFPCKSLTKEMKQRALQSLMFMILKRNG